ncbi:response regulator [soil metagenome]
MATQILIVDDDLDDIQLLTDGLLEVDPAIECQSAFDGEKAMSLLRSGLSYVPDYIFLDLNMPKISGKQVLAQLKKDLRLKDIPVIIYTTSNFDRDQEEAFLLGAKHFITKPTSLKELHNAIVSVFSQRWEKVAVDPIL